MVCISRHGWYTLYISKHLLFISYYQVYHGFLHIVNPFSAPSIPCPLMTFSMFITGVHNRQSILQAEIYHSLSSSIYFAKAEGSNDTLYTSSLCSNMSIQISHYHYSFRIWRPIFNFLQFPIKFFLLSFSSSLLRCIYLYNTNTHVFHFDRKHHHSFIPIVHTFYSLRHFFRQNYSHSMSVHLPTTVHQLIVVMYCFATTLSLIHI